MEKSTWKTYAVWILLAEAVGGIAGWLTREDVRIYNEAIQKPLLSPPSIVFPIVWGILFALMGISAARVYLSPPSDDRSRSLLLFFVQLVFNFCWSFLFFRFQNFGLAFFWLLILWVLIAWMILSFRKVDPLAAWLQLPYLIWVTFAAYLNLAVWILNR
jgi:benzodiazapine receptor